MRHITKIVLSILAINFYIGTAYGACFPKAPTAYGKYYPIQIKDDKGNIWKGLIYPTSTTVEIRDAAKNYVGKYQITSLTSSASCSTYPSYAKFKIKRIIGDDGRTWVKIERFSGTEKYKISVTWKGVTYTRSN